MTLAYRHSMNALLLAFAALQVPNAHAQASAASAPADKAPAACAGFVGTWEGTWARLDNSTRWLWVGEVDDKCRAKVAFLDRPGTPKLWATADIEDGTLTFPNRSAGGTFKFKRVKDEMWGSYVGAHGRTHQGVFTRAAPEAK